MKCQDCNVNEGDIKFSEEPTFALTHGFGLKMICKSCFRKRIIKHIEDCQQQLRELDDKDMKGGRE